MDMQLLLSKLDEKMEQQTLAITKNVTLSVMEAMDEKMNRIMEENSELKSRVGTLEEKVKFLERGLRNRNVIFYGLQETEEGECELVQNLKDNIIEAGVNIDCQEVATAYRLGKKGDKVRPVLAQLTTKWKKTLIFKNKKNLPPGLYVSEDYPKEILHIRKQLLPRLEEEKKKGNKAYIKYDKLVVKENPREKRKRDTITPERQPRKQQSTSTRKESRFNAYDVSRVNSRSTSYVNSK